MASLWDRIRNIIRPPSKPESSTIVETPAQNLGGVIVTDTSSGDSVKTTTTPSGAISGQTYSPAPTTTSRSGGGRSVSTLTSMGKEQTLALVQEQSVLLKPYYERTIAQQIGGKSQISQKIEELKETTPLGTPQIYQRKGFFESTSDYLSGQTGLVWWSGKYVPSDYKERQKAEGKTFGASTATGVRESILVGIPGIVGFTAEGKFKTAWSKDSNKRTNLKEFGMTSPLANVQSEWTEVAGDMRKSGKETKAIQELQIKTTDEIVKDLDKVTSDFSKNYDSKEFEERADKYSKAVEEFNVQFGEKELAPDTYKIAEQEKTKLDTERITLQAQQDFLIAGYDKYSKDVVSNVAKLRNVGVETNIDEQGNIAFASKALDTPLVTYKALTSASLSKNGKPSVKSVAYDVSGVAYETAVWTGVGFATGGTGVLAKIGAGVSKLPKVAQVVIKGSVITLAGVGVATKGYSGMKTYQSVGLPGWYGATIGTASGIGQVGGFAVGGYYGTKAYYGGVQDKILAGKYTKSIGEAREGKIVLDKSGTTTKGFARQLGIYETKIAGTKWTIKSGLKMQGTYGKDSGMSNIKLVSQFQGKAPRGMPKAWTTKGQTLESGDYVKLRAFTKSTKGKLWYEQDYLMKRTMLDRLKIDFSQKSAIKGYSELERLKFLTSIRAVGKPVKVGKVLPQQIWKESEVFRFTQWKGQGKVVQPWELGEAKADSIFGTKQFVFYKETKPLSQSMKTLFGDVKATSANLNVKEFQSIGKSSGMSAELLKQQLKDTILIMKQSQVNLVGDKSGQLNIFKPRTTTGATTIQKIYTPQVTKPVATIDSQAILKIQLSKIVPGLIQKQVSALKTSTLLFGAGIVGTKQLLETRQTLAVLNEQTLLQRTRQVSLQRVLQQQVPTQATSIRQAQVVQPIQLQTPILQTPVITMPIIQGIPGMPIIPGFDKPELWGWKYKDQKQTLAGKKSSSYIPDFTSKALGLKPKVMSRAQLKKLLRTDLTGLELRRGVMLQ